MTKRSGHHYGRKICHRHDLGTSGNKATLFSLDGRLIRSSLAAYETHYYNANWAEQDPRDWWKAVCTSTRDLMQGIDKNQVVALSFSAHMMACLCVDKSGRPLRPLHHLGGYACDGTGGRPLQAH